MFGRVRAASSTPNDLELERPSFKIIKDDSLSIYEATLMKLKLGAQRDVGPPFGVVMETETDCASSTISKCCSDAVSSHFPDTAYHSHAVLKSPQLVLPQEDTMMTDTNGCSLSISPSSSDCQSAGSLKQHRGKNVSVLDLFSRYWSSGQAKRSSEEVMMMENDGSSVSISHSSSDCLSMKSTNEQLEQDCVSSFPVCQM